MLFLPVIATVICLLVVYIVHRSRRPDLIPTVRYWHSIFPSFLDRLTYNSQAVRLIQYGYRKYGNQPFRLLKMDMDLIVLPLRYASELRAVTSDKLDPLTASFDDNAGDVTKILLGSELHTHAIQRRLTPRLPQIITILTDELRQTFHHVLPEPNDAWVEIDPYDTVLRLTSRAAARVFVGEHICRDEEFLETVASYSRNTFDTIASNRSFGRHFMSFLGNWFSTVTNAESQLQYVQKLLGSEVERRRACLEEEHDDFMQWCMDLARTEDEAHPFGVAHRTLGILSMAVVHTTAMATTHILFDMVSDETLKNSLRKEQEAVLKDGWMGISQQAMLDMKQLDSLMRESQRINPVGEFTFRRVVRSPITLSDGYQLNPGEQIAIPAKAINTDEGILADAHSFNPRRWIRSPDTAPAPFSNSSASNLQFGLGRYACPGRFLAAYAIKAITSRILLEYDFKLKDDSILGRPPNIIEGDKILPNRDAVVLLKRRNFECS
ncbi:P450 monooxygenase [Thozetella sp. PMI_491]|nr:P450 monooxygenase [Thozetella sp. PMI_491]